MFTISISIYFQFQGNKNKQWNNYFNKIINCQVWCLQWISSEFCNTRHILSRKLLLNILITWDFTYMSLLDFCIQFWRYLCNISVWTNVQSIQATVLEIISGYSRHLAYLGVQILVKRRRHRSSLFDNKERFSPEA